MNKKIGVVLALLALAMVAGSTVASARTISGRVFTAGGAPASFIQVSYKVNSTLYTTMTNSNGFYSFQDASTYYDAWVVACVACPRFVPAGQWDVTDLNFRCVRCTDPEYDPDNPPGGGQG